LSPKAGKRRTSPRNPPIPPISGPDLGKLLVKDGWTPGRVALHGRVFTKTVNGAFRQTVLSLKKAPLPSGTLANILGPKQTRIGKDGLRELLKRYGPP